MWFLNLFIYLSEQSPIFFKLLPKIKHYLYLFTYSDKVNDFKLIKCQ